MEHFHNGHGGTHGDTTFSNTLTYQHVLSAIETREEREAATISLEVFPCPDILWQGRFRQIAERLNKFTWEVWMGSLCAFGAVAHKNLHWQYYRPLYGMIYGLLVSPTGHGKGTCTDVCRALLPEYYTVRRSPSSGAGLFPILANITKDEKGKVLSITPHPAMLVIEEWTTLLKASKIEFSNLQETLNELFHSPFPFTLSRSDNDKAGGDREVKDPILSICATTTESLLQEYVSSKMIRSGFFNRYFVVPGSNGKWDFYEEEEAGVNVELVKGFADDLVAYAWGAGQNVWSAYTPDAKERLVNWGRLQFNPIMQSQSLEAESIKRLHVYAHIISLLYAWSEKTHLVLPHHVEAAITAVAISRAFVEKLMGTPSEVEIPKNKQYEMSLEQKIIEKVKNEPGVGVKKIGNDLRKSGTYRDLTETARRLAHEGQLQLVRKGRAESFFSGEGVPSEVQLRE